MASTAKEQNFSSPACAETVGEIMRIYKSLPPRPSIEEVEAALSVIKTARAEESLKLEEIAKQQVGSNDVPPELFSVLQEAKKTMVLFRSLEQMKEAVFLVELDGFFEKFDGLIRRASELVSGGAQSEIKPDFDDSDGGISEDDDVIEDESLSFEKRILEMAEKDSKGANDDLKGFLDSSKTKGVINSSAIVDGEAEKFSLMKVAAIIEKIAKSEEKVLDLQGKLLEKIEWLPLSLGKLSSVTELNLSENSIMALPNTIVGLKNLRKLDIHSNQLINLPDSFGELWSLTDLDLHANRLKSLPQSFGSLTRLVNLDLSTNHFKSLPNIIGNLRSLKMLNVETNDLEELPYTIGMCSSLVELRLDFNQLRALPEATGKLESLEILTLHYNRVKSLPSTIGNLSHLKELDVSFNELESIPESICFAVSLEKLNVSTNFADLTALPNSIGELEMLEELEISANQIKVLPDSFRFLSRLRVFRADETPLEVPPRHVAKLGARAVVQYMSDLVAERNVIHLRPQRRNGFCSAFCRCFGLTSRVD